VIRDVEHEDSAAVRDEELLQVNADSSNLLRSRIEMQKQLIAAQINMLQMAFNTDFVPELSVIRDVEHEDSAAVRDEELLQVNADFEWADAIEKQIRGSAEPGIDADKEPVFLFKFTRMPQAFVTALDSSPHFAELRSELDAHGLPYRAQRKARVLVWPGQYQDVMDAINEKNLVLETSSIVILESLMPVLEDMVAQVHSSDNVRVKSGSETVLASVAQRVPVPGQCSSNVDVQVDPVSEGVERTLEVQKTFLVAVEVREVAECVTQSTTEAHGGLNPRR